MKKALVLTLFSAVALQTAALNAQAQDSRVDAAIAGSAQARRDQISDLQAQITDTQNKITQLQDELKDAKNAHRGYKAGRIIRIVSLVSVGTGIAMIIHAGTMEGGGNLNQIPVAILGGVATVLGGVGTAIGQTMIWLDDDEIKLVNSKLKEAQVGLTVLQRHLSQISK